METSLYQELVIDSGQYCFEWIIGQVFIHAVVSGMTEKVKIRDKG